MQPDRMRELLRTFPWGVLALLGLGAWLLAAFLFSVTFPGAMWLGFLFGAASGVPVFFPAYSFMRRRAAWELLFLEGVYESAAGGAEELQATRKRVGAALGLHRADRQELLRRFTQALRWTPVVLCLVLALACVAAGADDEGVGSTMAAALGGLFAGWAVLFRLSGMRPIPGPGDIVRGPT